MIRRSTWWTLLTFLVLAAAAYAVGRSKHASEAKITPPPTTEPVITFSSDDVVGVDVQSAAQHLVLEKQNDQWQVVQPAPQGNEVPDQQRIETAVFDLLTMNTVNTVPAGTDLKALGLAQPVYTITVRLKDGKTWQITVGNPTPIESGYYVRANGRLLVVSKYAIDTLTNLLNAPPLITPMPTSTPTPAGTP